MKFKPFITFALVLFASGNAYARDQIRVVGSSTVFPFTAAVAEEFSRTNNVKAPVVESTGTGGGMKLFCQGIGNEHPDMVNASRAIKKSEISKCRENGVTDILEIKIGYDGIVVATSNNGPSFALTRKDLFLALAKIVPNGDLLVPNYYTTWNQINSSFPETKIEVLGPPPTSGTRDAFLELAMEEGAKQFPVIANLDSEGFKIVAHTIREDGAYVEAGENDNLIVQKLRANPDAFGIFGFSFLDNNSDSLKGIVVEGFEPTFENIANGSYPLSRSLYVYAKEQHKSVPNFIDFTAYYVSLILSVDNYLVDKGLIPLSEAEMSSATKYIK